MELGINYPWHHCGWDFGEAPRAWDPKGERRAEWKRDVDARLAEFRARGMSIVRWFVLADGTNVGRPKCSARTKEWEFEPEPLPAAHVEDFESLLAACERAGVRLLPSLVGIGWFRDPEKVDSDDEPIKGGRVGAIRDARATRAFLDGALEPLLDASAKHRDALYAWEVVNEPEWVTREIGLGRSARHTVDPSAMLAFIRDAAERILARTFRATVGFAHHESMTRWESEARARLGASLGLDLHQFHFYPRTGETLPPRPKTDAPCIVGELATRLDLLDPWSDLVPDSLAERLALVERRGYDAALLWSALPDGADRATAAW